ncbi:MAG: hypothetical protein ACI9FD_003303, partial [Gammaproteobacteria bacterium]
MCTTSTESVAEEFDLGDVNRSIEILNEKIEQNAYYASPQLGSPLYRLKNEAGGYLTARTNGELTLVNKKTINPIRKIPDANPDIMAYDEAFFGKAEAKRRSDKRRRKIAAERYEKALKQGESQLWVLGTDSKDRPVISNLETGRVLTRGKSVGAVVSVKAITHGSNMPHDLAKALGPQLARQLKFTLEGKQNWTLEGPGEGKGLDRLGILNSIPREQQQLLSWRANPDWINTPGATFQLKSDGRGNGENGENSYLTTCQKTVCTTADKQGSNSNWVLEPADIRQLGRLTIDVLREIKQSTGTDDKTEWVFEAIDTALIEAVTFGMGKGAGAIGKVAAKKLWGKAATEVYKQALKQAAKHSTKKMLTLMAKNQARWAARKASGETAKALAKVLSKKGLMGLAVHSAKHGVSDVTKRMVAKEVAKLAAKQTGKRLLRRAGVPRNRKLVLEALGKQDTTLSGYAFTKIFQGSCDNRDDLQIKVNDNFIWPHGGGSSRRKQVDCRTGYTKPQVDVIFPLRYGAKIGLVEHDTGSSSDSLGSVYFRTEDLLELAIVDDAMIPHTGEKSLYELSFSIEPYTADNPFSVEKRVKSVGKWITERDILIDKRMREMPGNWRVGHYTKGKKDRSITWRHTLLRGDRGISESDDGVNYSYMDAGFRITPASTGEWSLEDFKRWERPQRRVNAIPEPETGLERRHRVLSDFDCEKTDPDSGKCTKPENYECLGMDTQIENYFLEGKESDLHPDNALPEVEFYRLQRRGWICVKGKKVALKPAPLRLLESAERRRLDEHLIFASHDTDTAILGRSAKVEEGIYDEYNQGWSGVPWLLPEDPYEIDEYFRLRGLKTRQSI